MIKTYTSENIRNIVILGHANTGKSTLLDSLLFIGGKINKIGSHEDDSLVSDFDIEEKKRKMSVHTAMGFIEVDGVKVNIIDCPGHSDLVGERRAAIQAADGAILVVDSVDGVQVGTEKAWRYLAENNIPRIILVNKMDQERASYENIIANLEQNLHAHLVSLCIPMNEEPEFTAVVDILEQRSITPKSADGREVVKGDVPDSLVEIVKEERTKLVEIAAEGDDELIEMFLEGKEFDESQIVRGIREQIAAHTLHPVICGSAIKHIGIKNLIDVIIKYMPTPGERELDFEIPDTTAAVVWKTYNDQYAGVFNYIRVLSGKVESDSELINKRIDEKEKIGKLYTIIGKDFHEVSEIPAGDIGVVVKLNHTTTTHTLSDVANPVELPLIDLPVPVFGYAIRAASKRDEEKLSQILNKYDDQYPTLEYKFNPETRESVIAGMGQLHLDIILDEIKEKYKVEFETTVPQIAYRETITRPAESSYKHKKQSGGHGQYGEVKIKIEPEPRGDGFKFVDKIVGGAIPKQYIPGVEKGLHEAMEEGVLAKYPVVDVSVQLYDGTFHNVDSSEMAFKIAGSHAFKQAMEIAGPQLLEPVMDVQIYVDKEYMGDIMSDITSRRGKVLGMSSKDESSEEGITVISAKIPLEQMLRYSIDLKGMTQNKATFEMKFSHYDPITGKIAEKVIENRKRMAE